MTGTLDVAPQPTTGPAWATLALAIREAQLLLRHPVFLLGCVLLVTFAAQFAPENGLDQRTLYSEPALLVTMFLGIPTYFAANLRATHARRARTDELLDTAPTSPAQRTLALCLGALGPFLIAWALAIGLDAIAAARWHRVADPGTLRVLAAALAVLGGALLGIMIGRLVPVPGAALVTMVGIVTACLYLEWGADTKVLFSPYADWGAWTSLPAAIDVVPGSPGWHLVYIASLCLMAACGALLTHPQQRRTTMSIGAGATVLTIAAAIAQVP
jgi:hypothetical protein